MQLKVIKKFSWAHRGIVVEQFSEGQIIDTEDDELAKVAIKEKWAEKLKADDKKSALKARAETIKAEISAAAPEKRKDLEDELALILDEIGD